METTETQRIRARVLKKRLFDDFLRVKVLTTDEMQNLSKTLNNNFHYRQIGYYRKGRIQDTYIFWVLLAMYHDHAIILL